MKITKLSRQKRKEDRFSLYIDGSFAAGLSAETVARFNLREGKEINLEQLHNAIFEEEKQHALNYAFRLLSYRSRSQKEILERLKKRGCPENVTNLIIEELKASGLVDDKKFAIAFAQDRLNFAKKGKRFIFVELLRKGIPKSDVEEALKKINDETKVAQKLIDKYQKRYVKFEPKKRRKKLHDLLLRRGFTFKTINEVLEAHPNTT
jgi:regulatory protein